MNATVFIITFVITALAILAIVQHKAMRLAATEIATLRTELARLNNKPVSNPALNHLVASGASPLTAPQEAQAPTLEDQYREAQVKLKQQKESS